MPMRPATLTSLCLSCFPATSLLSSRSKVFCFITNGESGLWENAYWFLKRRLDPTVSRLFMALLNGTLDSAKDFCPEQVAKSRLSAIARRQVDVRFFFESKKKAHNVVPGAFGCEQ